MTATSNKQAMRSAWPRLLFSLLFSVTSTTITAQNMPLKQDISDASLAEADEHKNIDCFTQAANLE
ncbi:MAG: hypothetical protein BVN30_00135 [Proteobacteria bacterium ST_bin16]|nr:MAG: hypothetical protein BVN30_00135 [Proteobacteria bacterium ST_bin16]